MDLMPLMVDHQFTRVVSVLVHTWYMGTNCAPLPADLFLHAHEADFLHGILKNKDKKLAKTFNSIFRYIDDVLSLNNSRIGDYLQRIYSNQLEVQDTTDAQRYASYLDLHLEIDNENSTKNVTLLFKQSISLSSTEIFQHHQYTGVTFHISYIILQLMTMCRDFVDRAQLLTH